MRIGTGLSGDPDSPAGAATAARAAARQLDGAQADLALVFASGTHLADCDALLATVHDALAPAVLVGCGAGGVLGGARELEDGTGVAVWAAAPEGGEARPFHATVRREEEVGVLDGMPEIGSEAAVIMLSDPYSFPTDAVLDLITAYMFTRPIVFLLGRNRTIAEARWLGVSRGLAAVPAGGAA